MLQPLTTSEMKEFESYVCDNFDITLDDMMLSAGRAVFDVVMEQVVPELRRSLQQGRDDNSVRILVVAGKGNNGGDALVTARLLKEEGVDVTIFKVENQNSKFKTQKYDLIIYAIFGFSLKAVAKVKAKFNYAKKKPFEKNPDSQPMIMTL